MLVPFMLQFAAVLLGISLFAVIVAIPSVRIESTALRSCIVYKAGSFLAAFVLVATASLGWISHAMLSNGGRGGISVWVGLVVVQSALLAAFFFGWRGYAGHPSLLAGLREQHGVSSPNPWSLQGRRLLHWALFTAFISLPFLIIVFIVIMLR